MNNEIYKYKCCAGMATYTIISGIFKSVFKGIATALLAGIYAVGIGILYHVISRAENWEFTLVLIMIALFSSIYYYSKNE